MDAADRLERAPYTGALTALIGGAWLALGLLSRSRYVGLLSHDLGGDASSWPLAARVAMFVGGWTVMTVAIVLPSQLAAGDRLPHDHAGRAAAPGRIVAGYLLIWSLFGLLALAGDAVLHQLVEAAGWLAARTHLVSASLR